MAERNLAMRGFTCAVSRGEGLLTSRTGTTGIAVGVDDTGGDRRYAVALRHADGTVLTGFLSDDLLDRLALRLADLIGDEEPAIGSPTLQ